LSLTRVFQVVPIFEALSQNHKKWLLASSCLSLRPSIFLSALNSGLTGRIFVKFAIRNFFEKLSRKFKFHWSMTRTMGTLDEDYCATLIISRSFLLRMRTISDKMCRENQDIPFIFNSFFVRKSRHLWDDVEKYCRAGRPSMTIWRMCIACFIPKATNVLLEQVTLTAFSLQQWLHERTSVLCYTNIASLVSPVSGYPHYILWTIKL
jgi:hypothetical protein